MLINAVEQGRAEQLNSEVGLRRFTLPLPGTRRWSIIMSNIHLTLSSYKPWDATYRTPEGQVIYKVESVTSILSARKIKILKIMPSLFDNGGTTEGREAENMRDSFAHLATVEYHTFRSSRIKMGNLDVATNDYFRNEGWSLRSIGRLVFIYFRAVSLSPHYA